MLEEDLARAARPARGPARWPARRSARDRAPSRRRARTSRSPIETMSANSVSRAARSKSASSSASGGNGSSSRGSDDASDDEPAAGHRDGRPERLGDAPREPVAHRHGVLPGRTGHPLAGALVAGAALEEDAGALVPARLDRGPAVTHEVRRDVGRDAQPGRRRVAAVGQDRADRAAVRAIEPDDRHPGIDQALRQRPKLLRRAAVAMNGPAVGQLRPAVAGHPLDGPVPDRDPCRDGPVRRPRRRRRRPRSRARPRSRRRAGAARTAGAAPAGRR